MEHKLQKGTPTPLGATQRDGGINFSLFSQHATKVTLCLYPPDSKEPLEKITLDPKINRTGWIWHVFIENLNCQIEYSYEIDGPRDLKKGHRYDPSNALLDPYARGVNTLPIGEARICPI